MSILESTFYNRVWVRRRRSVAFGVTILVLTACSASLPAQTRSSENTTTPNAVTTVALASALTAPVSSDLTAPAPTDVIIVSPETTSTPTTAPLITVTATAAPVSDPAVTSPPIPVPATPPAVLLAGLGSRGVNVMLVQQALIVLGYLPNAKPDGIWGPATQQAWSQFEASGQAPMLVDGVFTSLEAGVVGGYASLYAAPTTTVPVPVTSPALAYISAACRSAIQYVRSTEASIPPPDAMKTVLDYFSGKYVDVPITASWRDISAYHDAVHTFTVDCTVRDPLPGDALAKAQRLIECWSASSRLQCVSLDYELNKSLQSI